MAYYVTCPHCGANLDPGERCDCSEDLKKSKRNDFLFQQTVYVAKKSSWQGKKGK